MSLEATQVNSKPVFRKARPEDGARMYELVKEMGGLELNTAYFYVLFCIDFADTCVVSEVDGKLAGFVLGHRPPERPDAIFVWQVGVAPFMRKQGMARRLLEAFLEQNPDARWLEASVTPSNTASRKLFRAVARDHDVECKVGDFMLAEHFPDGHEPEELFRIGPFESN
ncbi:diaminobutyrate acetyltransferase [Wenzhouxiangella sp. EGI_FJ10409]|uniref:diaminobutyrate acetyltransferase n=1 Tax=Wenzhouxiangella sp. EGI_FJ10409 TaxID=3243767 RepID=UPI0035DA1974